MDSNFEALVHITPWTKAVAFITSQLDRGDLIGEYFLVVTDDQWQLRKEKLGFHYPSNILEIVCPDGTYVKYGLEEMRSQATNELAVILFELFCQQTPSGAFDPRCYRFAAETPCLRPATMTTLARILPKDVELQFVYQTRNAELKQFLSNVFLIKKVVHPYSIE